MSGTSLERPIELVMLPNALVQLRAHFPSEFGRRSHCDDLNGNPFAVAENYRILALAAVRFQKRGLSSHAGRKSVSKLCDGTEPL